MKKKKSGYQKIYSINFTQVTLQSKQKKSNTVSVAEK